MVAGSLSHRPGIECIRNAIDARIPLNGTRQSVVRSARIRSLGTLDGALISVGLASNRFKSTKHVGSDAGRDGPLVAMALNRGLNHHIHQLCRTSFIHLHPTSAAVLGSSTTTQTNVRFPLSSNIVGTVPK